MPRPPIQIHLFRIYVRHYVTTLRMSIDYPVTGLMVVPTRVTNIGPYIEERQTVLAQLRMTNVLVGTQGYANTVAAMAMSADIRESLGIQPRMPQAGLLHMPVAAACEACEAIALCDRNRASYERLRERLEEISGHVTKLNGDFCQALSIRLNTYAE